MLVPREVDEPKEARDNEVGTALTCTAVCQKEFKITQEDQKKFRLEGHCFGCSANYRAVLRKSPNPEIKQWFIGLRVKDPEQYRTILADASSSKSKDASGYLRNPAFNLATYKESQKQMRGTRQSAPHELKTWPYYKDYYMNQVPVEERLTAAQVLEAWNRYIKDPELAEKTPVEDKKTGEVALRDAIWVKTGGLKRENFEEIRKSKSASKQFTTDKVTAANMQAIVKRASNFVSMAVDDEFYMRPGILAMQTFDDDFVPQGSQGTGSARARAKGKAKAKGKSKPDRLLDISLTRTQFTAKLVAQRQFCATAHQQAVEAADAFMRDNEELQNKFKAIQRAGVKEDRILSDKSLGLGDQAGIIKAFYALESRYEVSQAVLEGAPKPGTGGSEEVDTSSEAFITAAKKSQDELSSMIAQDGVMMEYAPKSVTVMYLSRQDLFDECQTRDEFQDKFKSIAEEAKHTKTLASMLRKCVKDMTSMIKAVDKAREAIAARAASASGDKKLGTLIGRVNFQKVVEESDPRILRQFKHLVEARPIPVIGSKDESEVGEIGADCPLVVRKGRTILKAIGEHPQCQKALDAALTEFKQQVAQTPGDLSDKRKLALIDHQEICTRAEDVMFGSLPSYWDSLCKVEDSTLKEASESMDGGEAALKSFQGVWLGGSPQNYTFAGCDMQGMPQLRLQVCGSKLVVVCSALEVARAWKTRNMQDLRALLNEMEAQSIPDTTEIDCFGAAVLRTGDLLHIPAGAMVVEKSINDMDISLRILGRHVPDESNASLRMVADQVRVKGYLELLLKALPQVGENFSRHQSLLLQAMKDEEEEEEDATQAQAVTPVAPSPPKVPALHDDMPPPPVPASRKRLRPCSTLGSETLEAPASESEAALQEAQQEQAELEKEPEGKVEGTAEVAVGAEGKAEAAVQPEGKVEGTEGTVEGKDEVTVEAEGTAEGKDEVAAEATGTAEGKDEVAAEAEGKDEVAVEAEGKAVVAVEAEGKAAVAVEPKGKVEGKTELAVEAEAEAEAEAKRPEEPETKETQPQPDQPTQMTETKDRNAAFDQPEKKEKGEKPEKKEKGEKREKKEKGEKPEKKEKVEKKRKNQSVPQSHNISKMFKQK